MSLRKPLTWHIDQAKQSQVGQFLQGRFSHASSLTKVANRQLRETNTLLPSVSTSSYPYGTIGMAIDYRIRYSFDLTPGRRLKAWKGAMLLTGLPSIPANENGEMVIKQNPYSLQLIQSFFDQLDATVKKVAPVGRRLEGVPDKELTRYCYVLSLFEQLYRNFSVSFRYSPLIKPVPKQNIDELLDIPQEAAIDDLCALSTLFYDNYHDLLSHHTILNPDFTGMGNISESDGDLIIDRCLIEVKTSIEPEVKSHTLWQLAGYLLLDYDDIYHFDSVSIYMARQGVLLSPWSISDFLRLLTGDNTVTLPQLRQEFRMLAEKGVEEKRKVAQTLQTRTVVEPSTARHWIARVSLDIAVLNAVLDNKLKMEDLNISELQKEIEKFSKIITSAISTVPHDVDNTVLESVKRIEQDLVAFWEKAVLIDGGISMEELIFMVRQLQITMVDVVSFLRSTVR